MDLPVNVKKMGLTSFQLKIIALVIMTIDHLAAFRIVTINADLMRMVGRIAAPLFLFLLAEGMIHTRSKHRYTLRLYIAGAAVQFANIVLERVLIKENFFYFGNILQTFMYTALFITCIESLISAVKEKKIICGLIYAIIMAAPFAVSFAYLVFTNKIPAGIYYDIAAYYARIIVPNIFTVEYSFGFVLLGIFWYFCRNKIIRCAGFFALSMVCCFVDMNFMIGLMRYIPFNFFQLFIGFQWMMVFAIPFILLYNGEKGKHSLKYFFYIYYPLHQYLFVILSIFILER